MNNQIGRVPPHSVEAEEQLLSACLLDGENVVSRAINAGITPNSFYSLANRTVFATLLDMLAGGKAIDSAVLAEELKTAKNLEAVGGYVYLMRIGDRVTTTAGVSYFIEKLTELAQLRDAIRAATGIVEACYGYTGGSPREHLAPDVERLNTALSGNTVSRKWADAVAEARNAAIERMKPVAERTANTWSVSWPWPDMDRFFMPIEPGELVVVAARPSLGKSSIARQLAWFAACNALPTLFHTLEVTDSELATNLAANVSGIRSRRDLDKLHHKDQAELIAAFDNLANPPAPFSAIAEDDTILAMLARAKAFKRKNGLRLWVIDYLGLIADCMTTRQGDNPSMAIGRVTRALKRFATAEGIPVVLLCQLNRGADNGDAVPKLSNLRDSGRIEEDANRVIFLHRPSEYEIKGVRHTQDPNSSPIDEPTHYIEVIQAKGRNTGTGTVALSFHRPTATFKSLASERSF